MKYMNHVKSGLLAMAFACAGICFTGCEDDVVINTGNSDKLDTVDGVYGYGWMATNSIRQAKCPASNRVPVSIEISIRSLNASFPASLPNAK